MRIDALKAVVLIASCLLLAACAGTVPGGGVGVPKNDPDYGEVQEGYITVAAIDPQFLQEPNRRKSVAYYGGEAPGTIVVDPYAKFLYFVEGPETAMRYPIAVGREGRGFSGQAIVGRKAEWPGWTPTANMVRREPDVYGPFARGIPGGKASPLGARALYLFRGGRDTYFRIHGTNDPATIGNQGSAGCIRMFNQDVIDLYARVPVGAQVTVRNYNQSVAAEGIELANRGGEMVPRPIDPVALYAFVEQEKQRKAAYEAGL
ncbi:MAG: L,D-transpeptidase [Pseudomonadota bacterium]